MDKILLIFSALFLLGGLVLRILARKNLTSYGHTLSWYNPKDWFLPPWKAVDVFTKRGLQFHITSMALIVMGVILYFIVRLFF